MAKPLNEVVDRLKSFIAAWRATAPNETFARMTLAEFEAANEAPLCPATIRKIISDN